MNDAYIFHPPRQVGYVFHTVAIAILITAGGWGIWQAANTNVGPTFLISLSPVLLALVLVPLLAYQLYALRNAYYALDREAVRLQWGLRVEIIPMHTVEWVGKAEELHHSPYFPWLGWPGSIIGRRRFPNQRSIEFLASRGRDLILIMTQERVFAISPREPELFLEAFQRLIELGSLSPPDAQSVHATFLLARFWRSPPARYLFLAGLLLSLGLLVLVSLSVPKHSRISLGFTPEGTPREPISSVQLLLLPVLNGIYFSTNFFIGLFFYRREDSHPLAYLLWGTSVLVAALFLGALIFILTT